MPNVSDVLLWLDSGVSNQDPSHTFWVTGQPLPLSARDFGLFSAFLIAALLLHHATARPVWLLGLLPLVFDSLNSFASGALGRSLYAPSNELRLATGLLAGLCLARALPLGLLKGFGPRRAQTLSLLLMLLALVTIAIFAPSVALAALGTVGVLVMLATANLLVRRMPVTLAWLLAAPELAMLAALKQLALRAIG